MYSHIGIEWPEGYTQKTNFFQVFTRANAEGLHAVKAAFSKAIETCGRNGVDFAQLVIVLDGIRYNMYRDREITFAVVYEHMLQDAIIKAHSILHGETLVYFKKMTGC